MSYLDINAISVSFDNSTVLDDFSLQMKQGETLAILGKSGCGKSTLLRCIAGFQPIESGQIVLDKNTLSTSTRQTPAENRNIHLMFQEALLLDHLTAEENIAFALHNWPKPKRKERITQLLDALELTNKRHHTPAQLSGGQKQRVALGRAIATSPKLLLLDEPFANVDQSTRSRLLSLIKSIIKSEALTTIIVTHDPNDAEALADTTYSFDSPDDTSDE